MRLEMALKADFICWLILLIAVWIGPVWVTKLAISIMIIWNGLCITWLSKCICSKPSIQNDDVPDYPIDGNFN